MILHLPNNYDNFIVFKNGFSTLGGVAYKFHYDKELYIED